MSISGIDIKTLDLRDALDLAILVEEEAQERYQELEHQMASHSTPEAGAFFAAMAANEAKHGHDLRDRRDRLFGAAPMRVKREMLWDVEAPEYDRVRAFMSVQAALEVALASEVKAFEFFVAALPSIEHPEVRALFEELRDEEVLHQSLVKGQMARIADELRVDADDYADGPVAQ